LNRSRCLPCAGAGWGFGGWGGTSRAAGARLQQFGWWGGKKGVDARREERREARRLHNEKKVQLPDLEEQQDGAGREGHKREHWPWHRQRHGDDESGASREGRCRAEEGQGRLHRLPREVEAGQRVEEPRARERREAQIERCGRGRGRRLRKLWKVEPLAQRRRAREDQGGEQQEGSAVPGEKRVVNVAVHCADVLAESKTESWRRLDYSDTEGGTHLEPWLRGRMRPRGINKSPLALEVELALELALDDDKISGLGGGG